MGSFHPDLLLLLPPPLSRCATAGGQKFASKIVKSLEDAFLYLETNPPPPPNFNAGQRDPPGCFQ